MCQILTVETVGVPYWKSTLKKQVPTQQMFNKIKLTTTYSAITGQEEDTSSKTDSIRNVGFGTQ